jgi:hypothetical protein
MVGKDTLNLLAKDSEIDKLKTFMVISDPSIFPWRPYFSYAPVSALFRT